MEVELTNLSKKFGDVVGVEALDLDIRDGEFVAFLGPSGCGKTTTLLMLAGIYRPTTGTIRFGDRIVNQLQPRDRNIGMVFQSYALYPHMTVFGNIAYPLKLKKVPRQEQQRRVEAAAETMGIAHLLDRRPGQLSGGQQQRVALGRALVKEPDILLFDEPLSNLDARLRLTMRGEIRSLQKRLGITAIYVTHDQVEALTMADRIAVMNLGRLQAFATPDDLYERPPTKFIAGFVGNPPMNFLEIEFAQENGAMQLRSESLELGLPPEFAAAAAAADGAVTFGIRPEDISLDDNGPVSGEVFVVEPLGRDDLLDIIVGTEHFLLLADPKRKSRAGDRVRLSFDMTRAHFFDPRSELALSWK
ncbi:MAG: ABC transporter ATP-binding protein [Anaerolineaceae bacterium]|nr:ABC transporter ATP-binding protein [Anaerolineaceae bacterium]MCY3906149.1 ABC transporter ATP-binding protein [Anaerolineaceae bacterium]